MFKFLKSTKENQKNTPSNEVVNNNNSDKSEKSLQTSPKKHGSDGVCCGGCGGQ